MGKEKLRKCFNCEEEKKLKFVKGPKLKRFRYKRRQYQIRCMKCGCAGPTVYNPNDAIKLWNSLGILSVFNELIEMGKQYKEDKKD